MHQQYNFLIKLTKKGQAIFAILMYCKTYKHMARWRDFCHFAEIIKTKKY